MEVRHKPSLALDINLHSRTHSTRTADCGGRNQGRSPSLEEQLGSTGGGLCQTVEEGRLTLVAGGPVGDF